MAEILNQYLGLSQESFRDIVRKDEMTGAQVRQRFIRYNAIEDEESFWFAPNNTVAGALTTVTADDTLTLSDSVARAAQTFTRAISETLTLADTAPRAAQAFTRTVSETLTLSDTAPRAATLRTRTASDPLALVDSVARAAQSFTRTTSDPLTLSDTAPRAATLRTRTVTETVTLSEAIARTVVQPRTVTETLTLSETATRAAVLRSRTTSDTLGLSESVARSLFLPRTTSDTLTLSDTAIVGGATPAHVVGHPDAVRYRHQGRHPAHKDGGGLTDAVGVAGTDRVVAPNGKRHADALRRPQPDRRPARTASDTLTFTDLAVKGAAGVPPDTEPPLGGIFSTGTGGLVAYPRSGSISSNRSGRVLVGARGGNPD
jgi:hypothetical protein